MLSIEINVYSKQYHDNHDRQIYKFAFGLNDIASTGSCYLKHFFWNIWIT